MPATKSSLPAQEPGQAAPPERRPPARGPGPLAPALLCLQVQARCRWGWGLGMGCAGTARAAQQATKAGSASQRVERCHLSQQSVWRSCWIGHHAPKEQTNRSSPVARQRRVVATNDRHFKPC